MPRFFHVTTREALPEILASGGLTPRIGPRSMECNENRSAIYSFPSMQAIEDANWLADAFDDVPENALLILEFEAEGGEPEAFEHRFYEPIPLVQIRSLSSEDGARLDHLLTQAKVGNCWPLILSDEREIAEYVTTHATGYVDAEAVEDGYIGAYARLELVQTCELEDGPAEANVPSAAKQRRYAKMNPATRPPILVEGNRVVDGNHRLRDARTRGEPLMWCYVVDDGPAPVLTLVNPKSSSACMSP